MIGVDSLNALSGGGETLPGQKSDAVGKEDFLKLLVAQLEQQDPLEPMESTEFVAQLAQFSSLEQLMTANENLGVLQLGQLSISNGQYSSLIGKEVDLIGASSSSINADTGPIRYNVGEGIDEVTIRISDKDGKVVREVKQANIGSGERTFTWDGLDSNGNPVSGDGYNISITGSRPDGTTVDIEMTSSGVVSGVFFEEGVPMLEVNGRKVKVGDVIAIKEPSTTKKSEE